MTNSTSIPWWRLASLTDRARALRARIEAEIGPLPRPDIMERTAIAVEPPTPRWHPPRQGTAYHQKVKRNRK